MACLALSIQPAIGPDLLLQTREWFLPARALAACQGFRNTRAAFSSDRRSSDGFSESLGDDALAASGGQVVVGTETKYRVVYRLVNSVYVLGISSADVDGNNTNVFDCTGTVNQAVSILVAACRGVDVTPDKIARKYAEVYGALDTVLRGATAVKLASLIAQVSGDRSEKNKDKEAEAGSAAVAEAESRQRGAASWAAAKQIPLERLSCMELMAQTGFELPEETLAAGDAAAVALGHPPAPSPLTAVPLVTATPAPSARGPVDPFAASDALAGDKALVLVDTFAKPQGASMDPVAGLAELTVPAPGAATGFEDADADLAFADEGEAAVFGGGLGELLDTGVDDGFRDDAFGGGLDASEFGASVDEGFGGGLTADIAPEPELTGGPGPGSALEALLGGIAPLPPPGGPEGSQPSGPDPKKSRQAVMWVKETLYAEFKGVRLVRVGLRGTVFLRPALAGLKDSNETEFSFQITGAAAIRASEVNNRVASSLGGGLFHVRTPSSEEHLQVFKYSLQPGLTPLPLRARLVTRDKGQSLAIMVQLVGNPYLPAPLAEVEVVVELDFIPETARMSPLGSLHRIEKKLRWVAFVQAGAPTQAFRAEVPVPAKPTWALGEGEEGEAPPSWGSKVRAKLKFGLVGSSLSGIAITPARETQGAAPFVVSSIDSGYETGELYCSP